MKLRNTAIALGIGAATATGLSLLKVNKDLVIGSTAVVVGAGLMIALKDEEELAPLDPIDNKYLSAKNDLGDEYESTINDYNLYNQMIEFNEKDSSAYHKRGICKYNFRDFIGAIKDFNKAISLCPNDNFIYTNRGDAKYYLSDFQGSIEDYTYAINNIDKDYTKISNIDVMYPRTLSSRGASKIQIENHHSAIDDCNKAISIVAEYNYIGIDDFEKDKLDDCDIDILFDSYCIIGLAKACLGRHEDSIESFNRGLYFNSQSHKVYKSRGISKLYLEDLKGACEDWKKAAKLGDEEAKKLLEEHCG